jgi:pyruvate,orthophosphate dikinase
LFGATIETPRGAVTAADLAQTCDFFSVGTNDLTQYTWALDRDSAHATVIAPYLESKIFTFNPFSKFDYAGVGSIMKDCIFRGRGANPKLQVGITGHFGSDPELGQYFESIGVDYVGCSLDRISGVSLAYARRQAQEG